MAIFLPGMPCPLCEHPMTSSEDVALFGPFIADRSDPLLVFSDAAVHRACLDRHPLRDQALEWKERVSQNGAPSRRICVVCNEVILVADHYYGTGLLTRDESSPLFSFNFIHLHRSHVEGWERAPAFKCALEEARLTKRWHGRALEFPAPHSKNVIRLLKPSDDD